MLRIAITLACGFLFLNATAQHRMGLSSSVDATDAVRFASLDGASSSDGGVGYSLSLSYLWPLNTHWCLQTGLSYRHAEHTIIANVPPQEIVPDRVVLRNLTSIPVIFRRYFGSHTTRFYLDMGSSVDLEHDVQEDLDSNSGLSLIFSPGLEQKLGNTLSLNLAPQLQIYSLVPFQKEIYHRRLLTKGIELSLLYSLE